MILIVAFMILSFMILIIVHDLDCKQFYMSHVSDNPLHPLCTSSTVLQCMFFLSLLSLSSLFSLLSLSPVKQWHRVTVHPCHSHRMVYLRVQQHEQVASPSSYFLPIASYTGCLSYEQPGYEANFLPGSSLQLISNKLQGNCLGHTANVGLLL